MVDRLFERDETRIAVLTAAEVIRTEHDVPRLRTRSCRGQKAQRSPKRREDRMGPPPLLREPYRSGHYEELWRVLLVSQNIHLPISMLLAAAPSLGHRCEGRHRRAKFGLSDAFICEL